MGKQTHASLTFELQLKQMMTGLKPGDKLPPVRRLTEQFRVSASTVSKALGQLQKAGLVEARPGDGTYLREAPEPIAPEDFEWQTAILGAKSQSSELLRLVKTQPPASLSLASGYMDESLLPAAELSRASTRANRDSSCWARAPVEGLHSLRLWFARRLDPRLRPDEVFIVPGGQAAIRTVFQAICSPGEAMIIECPSYVGAIAAARALGISVVPVSIDTEGLVPERLEQALKQTGAKAIYCQPCFSNPTGATMSENRKKEILALAHKYECFIVEDDYVRELSFGELKLSSLLSQDPKGNVISIHSLTKSVAPSLRVGAIAARGPIMARIRAARVLDDFFVAKPLQQIALDFVDSAAYEKHLRKVRTALAQRMQRVFELLPLKTPRLKLRLKPKGGFCLWIELPAGITERNLLHFGQVRGLRLSPGEDWYPGEPSGQFIRLGVGGIQLGALETAFDRLSLALSDAQRIV